ncbi:NAD(P)-dependent oxidoreductase [Pseudomonas aeruginosa]
MVLINTARGALIDEAALLHALEAGTVAAAGLDVLEQEGDLSPKCPRAAADWVVIPAGRHPAHC